MVAHFDHGIREDSASVLDFVEALADRYKYNLFVGAAEADASRISAPRTV